MKIASISLLILLSEVNSVLTLFIISFSKDLILRFPYRKTYTIHKRSDKYSQRFMNKNT